MPTEKKVKVVDELQQVFARTSIGIVTDYRGLKTAELNDLRSQLRAANVDYKVIKNSLAQIAAKNAGLAYLDGEFKGPAAIAFGYGDVTKAVKAIADYIKNTKSTLVIKSGFFEGRILTADDLDIIARLPSREVLLAKVAGGMKAPMYGLVNVLAGPIRGMVTVLQARIKQLEAN